MGFLPWGWRRRSWREPVAQAMVLSGRMVPQWSGVWDAPPAAAWHLTRATATDGFLLAGSRSWIWTAGQGERPRMRAETFSAGWLKSIHARSRESLGARVARAWF